MNSYLERLRRELEDAIAGATPVPSGAKAPEWASPRGMSPDEVVAAIFPEMRRMDSGLADCESKFGTKTEILDHPFLGPLNPEQWRKFHLAHVRHHARQIRQRLTKTGRAAP